MKGLFVCILLGVMLLFGILFAVSAQGAHVIGVSPGFGGAPPRRMSANLTSRYSYVRGTPHLSYREYQRLRTRYRLKTKRRARARNTSSILAPPQFGATAGPAPKREYKRHTYKRHD